MFVNPRPLFLRKAYAPRVRNAGSAMAGFLPHPRTASRRAAWPREFHRAALLLGASATLYWSSFALGRVIVGSPGGGPIYVDLLLAWLAVIVHVAAWPNLWIGLRDFRTRHTKDDSAVLAWRAFLLTLGLIFAAVVLLPFQYHTIASTDAWLLVIYVTAFPYLGWTFVPVLALHGILFGRVATHLDPKSRLLADAGAILLFAVAAATTVLILQNPEALVFLRSWSVGRGILPASALVGYVLIASGMTIHVAPIAPRVRSWTPVRVR